MRNTFCLIICLLSLAAKSQEKFIEVTAADTLIAEPEKWNYAVYALDNDYEDVTVDSAGAPINSDRNTYQQTLRKKQQQRAIKMEQIKKLAIENGAIITGSNDKSDDQYRYYDNSNAQNQMIFMQFNQRLQLAHFVTQLKQFSKVSGNVISTFHSNENKFIGALYSKLISQARKKGEIIAALSHKKLGEILQVSEGSSGDKSASDKFFEAMLRADKGGSIPGWHVINGNDNSDKIVLEKSIRVRFAIQ